MFSEGESPWFKYRCLAALKGSEGRGYSIRREIQAFQVLVAVVAGEEAGHEGEEDAESDLLRVEGEGHESSHGVSG
jgi:hypothetical protein